LPEPQCPPLSLEEPLPPVSTVMLTVAGGEVARPSKAVKVKLSAPT
jgi:hypothetical protein